MNETLPAFASGNMKKDDKMNESKPAFPVVTEDGFDLGLTKREYIAAMAMQGLMAYGFNVDSESNRNCAAENSVRLADALLAALSQPTTKPER